MSIKPKTRYCRRCDGIIWNRQTHAVYCLDCAEAMYAIHRREVYYRNYMLKPKKKARLALSRKQRYQKCHQLEYLKIRDKIDLLRAFKARQQKLAKPDWERVIEADMLIFAAKKKLSDILLDNH